MPDISGHALPAPSHRRSASLSSLTSFSSSMSIFQPTPPLDPASPPMPIPDTFDLNFEHGAKRAPPTTKRPQATPETPTTPTTPTACTMPATPPPSATRSSKRQGKTTPSAASSRPAKLKPPRPTRTTAPRGRRHSLAARQQQNQSNSVMVALQVENRALRRAKWALENTNALLRARLLTGAEQVQHAHAVEAQLDHAQRYVRALRKQVRSLGGFVMGLGGGSEGRDGEDGEDGDDSDDNDGELPATHVPACFPDAARNPHKYTTLAMQRERALGKKTKPKLKY